MEVEEQRTTVGHDFNMKRRVISMTVDAIYHYCVHDEYQLQCCVHCSARKIWMTAIIYDASRIIYFISFIFHCFPSRRISCHLGKEGTIIKKLQTIFYLSCDRRPSASLEWEMSRCFREGFRSSSCVPRSVELLVGRWQVLAIGLSSTWMNKLMPCGRN